MLKIVDIVYSIDGTIIKVGNVRKSRHLSYSNNNLTNYAMEIIDFS